MSHNSVTPEGLVTEAVISKGLVPTKIDKNASLDVFIKILSVQVMNKTHVNTCSSVSSSYKQNTHGVLSDQALAHSAFIIQTNKFVTGIYTKCRIKQTLSEFTPVNVRSKFTPGKTKISG